MFHKVMSFMGRSTVHPTERAGLKQPGSPAERRQVLFQLLDDAMSAGARVVQVRQLDDMVVNRHAALVLKHDVHGLNLAGLLAFARAGANMGILGSYFFMPPDHPDTARHYGFSDLIMLDPPRTGDALCDEKRRNWIDWRAAPYQVKRHSEMFVVEKSQICCINNFRAL